MKRLFRVAVVVLAFLSNALDSREQSKSSVTISVDTNKPVWESVRKVLNDKGYSYSQVNDNRMVTDYIKWDNALVSNRGKIQISLDGNNLRVEMVERQFAANNQWVDAIGELSKKAQEKYLLPITATITETLNSTQSPPKSEVVTSEHPIISDRGFTFEINQIKLIGKRLLIKGKIWSQNIDVALKISGYNQHVTTDDNKNLDLYEYMLGSDPFCGSFMGKEFARDIPQSVYFTFNCDNTKANKILKFGLDGVIFYNNAKENYNLTKCFYNLPIPYNINKEYYENGYVEIMDDVFIKIKDAKLVGDNLELNVVYLNRNNEDKLIQCQAYDSYVVNEDGAKHPITVKIGSADGNSVVSNEIVSNIPVSGKIIVNNYKNTSLPYLQLNIYNNPIQFRNITVTK